MPLIVTPWRALLCNMLNLFKDSINIIYMNGLDELYKDRCRRASDINQHLPTLKKYAAECDHVTEMGVRGGDSTRALAAARPKTLICYDIVNCNVNEVCELATQNDVDFIFKKQDVIESGFVIDNTDLLFIDTMHNYNQLRTELSMHGDRVLKYIILHDTTTFGERDEFPNVNPDSLKRGLVPAVDEFISENEPWKVLKEFTNNNGLTILTRV